MPPTAKIIEMQSTALMSRFRGTTYVLVERSDNELRCNRFGLALPRLTIAGAECLFEARHRHLMQIDDLLVDVIWIVDEVAAGAQVRVHAALEVEANDLAERAQHREMTMHGAVTARAVIVLDDAKHQGEISWLGRADRTEHAVSERLMAMRSPRLDAEALRARTERMLVVAHDDAVVRARSMKIETLTGLVVAK